VGDEGSSLDSSDDLSSDNLTNDALSKDLLLLQTQKRRRRKDNLAAAASEQSDDSDDDDEIESAVMYIGHIPHGFYEREMRGYFSQFGKVLAVRVSRNRKTGHSKGYGFVKFQFREVADIVAKAMNNYIMFGRTLKCSVLPPDRVHPNMFKNTWKRPRNPQHFVKLNQERYNAKRTPEQQEKRMQSLVNNENKKRKRLDELGINYDFPGYQKVVSSTSTDVADTRSTKKQKTKKSTPSKNRTPKSNSKKRRTHSK